MFRMTKMTDYGIVLLTQFAAHQDRPAYTARELAQDTRLPLPTVGKLLKQLSHGGLLVSHRGTRGGYSLALPAREVTVASIIAALEGPVAITECNAAIRCEHESFCSTRPNWQVINDTIRASLEQLTLADMTHPLPPRLPLQARSLPTVAPQPGRSLA